MAEKINYGESQAVLAQRGVDAFNTASQNNIANVKAELDKVAAELAAGIQVGMTPAETAALNTRLNNLKSQAQTLTGEVQASYDFATGQSKISNQEYNQQILAMQEAQRRNTAQTLNQLQSVSTPGGYSSVIAENEENIRRQAAAEQAFMTGRGSVPADMQRITPGLLPPSTATQGGVIGVTGGTQQLFQSALSSAQQSALANLSTSQLRLQQELESEARATASAREAKQREKYEDFKIAAVNSIVNLTSNIGSKTAELEAAAASADTRSGRQVANAELDQFKKQSAITLSNQLATIRAQARSAGFSQEQVVEADYINKVRVGKDLNLGAFVTSRINTLRSSPRIVPERFNPATGKMETTRLDPNTGKQVPLMALPNEAGFVTDTKGKILTLTGKDGFLLDSFGTLTYYGDQSSSDPKNQQTIDLYDLNNRIGVGLGSASIAKDAAARNKVLSEWFSDPKLGIGDPVIRKAVSVLLGSSAASGPEYWQKSFTSNLDFGVSKLPPVTPTTKAKVPTPSPQRSPVPQSGFVNPSAPILNITNAFNLIEAAKNAEAGKIQSRMYYAPNNVVYNMFTYKGKTYYSPKGSTAEVYTKDSNDRFKRVYG